MAVHKSIGLLILVIGSSICSTKILAQQNSKLEKIIAIQSAMIEQLRGEVQKIESDLAELNKSLTGRIQVLEKGPDLTALTQKDDDLNKAITTLKQTVTSNQKSLVEQISDNSKSMSTKVENLRQSKIITSDCTWREVGKDISHVPGLSNICGEEKVLSTIDLDSCGNGGVCPIIKQVACCRLKISSKT